MKLQVAAEREVMTSRAFATSGTRSDAHHALPRKTLRLLAATALLLYSGVHNAEGSAVNFQDPNDWSVGDPDSTFQEWNSDPIDFLGDPDVFMFSTRSTAPSSSNMNPALSADPNLGVNSPGFVGSSGGYYAFNGNYRVYADILNHGGSAGSGQSYAPTDGTRVIVQVAATLNEDPNDGGPASVFPDSLELVQLDGRPLEGGEISDSLYISEVSDPNLLVDGPFGLVQQQEFIAEFWLPGFTGDFRFQTDSIVHSSFQHLRIDTLIVSAGINADFNGDMSVDGLDFLTWQVDSNSHGSELLAWEAQYGSTPPHTQSLHAVPEPYSLTLLVAGLVITTSCRTIARRHPEDLPC